MSRIAFEKIFFKPTIICIVGPSGAGKTMAAKFIEHALGIPMLVSYTTRPQRPGTSSQKGEVQGVDHWFVKEDETPPQNEMLAYTFFGGNHYWTLKSQVPYTKSGICTYTIDEKGLQMLKEQYSEEYSIVSFLIKRNRLSLIEQVGEERVNRDLERMSIPEEEYDEVIVNDGPIECFLAESIKRTIKYLPQ